MAIDLGLLKVSTVVVGRIVTFREEPGRFGQRIALRIATDGGELLTDYMTRSLNPRSKYSLFVSQLKETAGEYVEQVGELCIQFELVADQRGDFNMWAPRAVVDPYVDPLDLRIYELLSPLGDVVADQETIYGLVVTSGAQDADVLAQHVRAFRNYAYRAVALRLADLELGPEDQRGVLKWRQLQPEGGGIWETSF